MMQLLRYGTGVTGGSVLARETGVSIKPGVPTPGQPRSQCLRAREAGDRDLAIYIVNESPIGIYTNALKSGFMQMIARFNVLVSGFSHSFACITIYSKNVNFSLCYDCS
jgi:hypothetical protein